MWIRLWVNIITPAFWLPALGLAVCVGFPLQLNSLVAVGLGVAESSFFLMFLVGRGPGIYSPSIWATEPFLENHHILLMCRYQKVSNRLMFSGGKKKYVTSYLVLHLVFNSHETWWRRKTAVNAGLLDPNPQTLSWWPGWRTCLACFPVWVSISSGSVS